jgi:hypothetical protein
MPVNGRFAPGAATPWTLIPQDLRQAARAGLSLTGEITSLRKNGPPLMPQRDQSRPLTRLVAGIS